MTDERDETTPEADRALIEAVARRGPREAAELLESEDDDTMVAVLRDLNPAIVQDILGELNPERLEAILDEAANLPEGRQWALNQNYEDGTIGRLMEAPSAVFDPDVTVDLAIEAIRELVKKAFVTYGFVVDEQGRLEGLITMRDLLLSDRSAVLSDIMLQDVFYLKPTMELREAMKLVLNRHFPVYPVCDDEQRLLGQVRGQAMFEEQAFEISAQ